VVQPFVDLTSRIVDLPPRPVEIGSEARPNQLTLYVQNQGNTVADGRLGVMIYLSADGQSGQQRDSGQRLVPRTGEAGPEKP